MSAPSTDDLVRLLDSITPGKWSVCEYDAGDVSHYDHNGPCPAVVSEGMDCSVVYWDGFKRPYWSSANGQQKQITANARAIALVPDLLSELICLRGEVEAMGWRPIETAPRDGTRVLATTNEHAGPLIVSWRGKWPASPTKEWRDDEIEGDTYINISHWMPLPNPPAAPTTGESHV